MSAEEVDAAGPPPTTTARPSFFADVANTTATQGVTALLNVASLAIISRRLGSFDLGLYTLERRGCALIQPVVLLGVIVATPRAIALALGRGRDDHASYALAGGLLVAGTATTVAAAIALWPEPVAAAVFGDRGAVGLAYALAGLIVAAALYQIVYSIFRGYLRMGRANALELAAIGVVPVTLAAFGPTDFLAFMWLLNGGVVAVTLLALVSLTGWARPVGALRALRERGRELLVYGLPRTPGDFATVAPFALAPVAVVHVAGAAEAGYVSVVLSTLNLVSIFAGPLGVLVLPHVALEVGGSGVPGRVWASLAEATLDVVLGVAGLLFLASPLVVAIWFPDVPPEVVDAERVVAAGLPGYVFYLVFRSYLDAIDARPLSSIATVTGLGLLAVALPLLLAAPFFSATVAAAAAVSLSVTAMGAVTWWLVVSRLSHATAPRQLVPVGLAALAIAALGLAVAGLGAAGLALATLLAGLGYAALLVALRRPWLVQLSATLRARRGEGRCP